MKTRHIESFKPIKLPDQLKFEKGDSDDEDQTRFKNLPGYRDKEKKTLTRKEERKQQRQNKKQKKRDFYSNKGKKSSNDSDDDEDDDEDNNNGRNNKKQKTQHQPQAQQPKPTPQVNKSKAQIMQDKIKENALNEQKKLAFLKSIGKTKQDLMSADDKEIAMLEKKLGLNKKKGKKSTNDSDNEEDDGLNEFLKDKPSQKQKLQQSKNKKVESDEEDQDSDNEQPEEEGDNPSGASYIDDMFDDLEKTLAGGYSDEDDDENPDLEYNYDDDDLGIDQNEQEDNEEDDGEEEEDEDNEQEDGSEGSEDGEEDGSEDGEEEEIDEKDLKEDIYGRVINKKTGEIVKDNKIVDQTSAPSNKYVPPHLRNVTPAATQTAATTTTPTKSIAAVEVDPILKRKVNGLLNKLAINNFYPIFNEINDLFNTNPRASMKQILTDLIITNCCDKDQVQHHIIHISCALLSGLHSSMGTDIGGMFVETVFKGYNQQLQLFTNGQSGGNGNLVSNYLLLFIHLYNFQVLGSKIILDMANNFICSFRDIDIQLLLLLIQNAGYQLRGEDPATLKDIILIVQKKQLEQKQKRQDELMNSTNGDSKSTSLEEQEKVTKLSFMMDTISNLKNNKIKNTKLLDTLTSLKKVIKGALKSKDLSMNNNQMKLSWDDLQSIETKGRWWLVGSSWAGNDVNPLLGITSISKSASFGGDNGISIKNIENNSQLIKLAIENKMNTDLRKSIFCILMSSEDYLDAFDKLMELKLKDKQDREVIHVLMHCCLKEKKFNPYYYHLVYRLCIHDNNFKFTLQYDIWDQLKEIERETSITRINNFSNLLARLIENHVFSLTILRVIDLNQQLSPVSIVFFRILFTYLLTVPSESDVTTIFERLVTSTQNKVSATKESQTNALSLKKGINLFFLHGLLSSDSKNDEKYKLLKHRIKISKQVLKSTESILL